MAVPVTTDMLALVPWMVCQQRGTVLYVIVVPKEPRKRYPLLSLVKMAVPATKYVLALAPWMMCQQREQS